MPSSKQRFRRHLGASLVGMLVGLVLGLIAVISMMSVYKTLVFRGLDMRTAAKQDTQLSAALMAAHLDIQKAGYGIEALTNSCLGAATPGPSATLNVDLVMVKNPVLATPLPATSSTLSGTSDTSGTKVEALVWRWVQSAGVNSCAGLVVVPKDPLKPEQGTGLVRLTGDDCNMSATNLSWWSSQTWSMETLIEPGSLPVAVTAASATPSNPAKSDAIAFSAVQDSCTPFGAGGASTTAVVLTITGGNSTGDSESTTQLCLPNICQ